METGSARAGPSASQESFSAGSPQIPTADELPSPTPSLRGWVGVRFWLNLQKTPLFKGVPSLTPLLTFQS